MEEFKYKLKACSAFLSFEPKREKTCLWDFRRMSLFPFFISHELNMIDPIYAHYYFSVISHFGSGDRIKVLIFFNC